MHPLTTLYYQAKPFIPRRLQVAVRRSIAIPKRLIFKDVWPIDERAGVPPSGWRGWPDGKKFALILTHDVDTARGQERCADLMRLEQGLGFRSLFNFVPERYDVSPRVRTLLTDNGFEVGVHGLDHKGNMFRSREEFLRQAGRINKYIEQWGAAGFRAPSMYRNLDWIGDLNIEYDLSTFDTDPFEPQSDGAGTIFPFLVRRCGGRPGYVEMPYTLAQDFTLFVLMEERDSDIWKLKLDWIVEKGGMALLNAHPDYMAFGRGRPRVDEYSPEHYADFLDYAARRYGGDCWHALPAEVARFFVSTMLRDERNPADPAGLPAA